MKGPPSTPEWWRFRSTVDHEAPAFYCLGQTAYSAGRKASAYFHEHWTALTIEHVGPELPERIGHAVICSSDELNPLPKMFPRR